jgi:hypothetical protein
VVLNRLQEEPLNVGRGAPFLSRHFRPLGHEGVAAPLNSSVACRTTYADERRGQCRDCNKDLSIS